MHIDIITIFPAMFPPLLGVSMLKRAQAQGALSIAVHDLRRYTHDAHRTVDDRPYGGGPGMVMKVEPIAEAVAAITQTCLTHHAASPHACETILLCPQGARFSSAMAAQLAQSAHLVLICGHYEGVDERVRALSTRAISIGDYVLTGGELPAMVVIDGISRFIPGVLGHAQATREESFVGSWLEYPQYTRPKCFQGMAVPEVLLSGDHERIATWRRLQSVARTWGSRADLCHKFR